MRQMQRLARAGTSQMAIAPIVELVEDPAAVVEAAVDLTVGARRPTRWMQRMRRGSGTVSISAESGVPLYDQRVCCGEALRQYEGRGDLQMPFNVTCPECARVFRVRLDVVRVRR